MYEKLPTSCINTKLILLKALYRTYLLFFSIFIFIYIFKGGLAQSVRSLSDENAQEKIPSLLGLYIF